MAHARLRPALVLTALALSALACQTIAPQPTPRPAATATGPREPTPTAPPAPTTPPDAADRPNLTGRDHSVAQPAASAGAYLELSGDERVYDTARFRIHYTLTGEDSIPAAPDSDDTPDFVFELAGQLEGAWDLIVGDWGWVAPPPDQGWGGNDLYDVYIGRDDEDALGYVWTVDELPMGDNPNSPDVIERQAQGSYMHLRRGFATGAGFSGDQERDAYLHTTVVHEFMHAVQYGYDGGERPEWMWEAVAMWSEGLAFPGESDDYSYVLDYVSEAGNCLSQADPYSVWPFFRYLSDHHDRDLVREIWEQARDYEGINAVRAALRARGLSVSAEWLDFAQAMLLRDFANGDDFHPLIPADRIDAPGSVQRDVGQLGFEAIVVVAEGPITLSLSGDAAATGRIIGIRGGQAEAFDLSTEGLAVDADDYDELVVLVAHATDQSGGNACISADYRLRVSPGGSPAQPTDIIDAPKFTTLR